MKNVAEAKKCVCEYRPIANMTSQIGPFRLISSLGLLWLSLSNGGPLNIIESLIFSLLIDAFL